MPRGRARRFRNAPAKGFANGFAKGFTFISIYIYILIYLYIYIEREIYTYIYIYMYIYIFIYLYIYIFIYVAGTIRAQVMISWFFIEKIVCCIGTTIMRSLQQPSTNGARNRGGPGCTPHTCIHLFYLISILAPCPVVPNLLMFISVYGVRPTSLGSSAPTEVACPRKSAGRGPENPGSCGETECSRAPCSGRFQMLEKGAEPVGRRVLFARRKSISLPGEASVPSRKERYVRKGGGLA